MYANYYITYFHSFITIIILILMAAFFVLWERRLLAAIQRRVGPNRVGKGYLQPIADAVKLVIKENIVPKYASSWLFWIAPCFSLSMSLLLCIFLPYYINNGLIHSCYTLLYYYAFSSLSVFGIILAGWASKSKYPLLGAVRACASIISYEVVIGVIIVIIILATQSASFSQILMFQKQNGWLFWFIPVICPVIFITSLAELNRTPFDLTESEAELVAGYNVEYSGLIFAFFMLAEYINIINNGFIIIIVFFGGGYLWSDNTGKTMFIFFSNLYELNSNNIDNLFLDESKVFTWFELLNKFLWYCYYKTINIGLLEICYWTYLSITSLTINYYVYMLILTIKLIVYGFLVILVRATLPRYRYDQLIELCWKKYLPLCLMYLIGIAVYIIFFIL